VGFLDTRKVLEYFAVIM